MADDQTPISTVETDRSQEAWDGVTYVVFAAEPCRLPAEILRLSIGRPDSICEQGERFATPSLVQVDLMAHARLQAGYLNERMGRQVAGGRLLVAFLQKSQAVVKDLGVI